MKRKVCVDFDGTLATEYWENDAGGYDPGKVGWPVLAMVERVRRWLARGDDVFVLTARVNPSHGAEVEASKAAIEGFCLEQFGRVLEVTCMKDSKMDWLYDDKAVGVEKNTGRILGITEEDLESTGDAIGDFLR